MVHGCRRTSALLACTLILARCTSAPTPSGPAFQADSEARPEHPSGFEQWAVDVFERRCGVGCHAVSELHYVDFMADESNAIAFYFPVDPRTGRFTADPALQRIAHEVAVGIWSPDGAASHAPHARIDFSAEPEYSPMLRHPLSELAGGLPHRGVDVFVDEGDPDYVALQRWVRTEVEDHVIEPAPLAPNEAFFRDEVLGVFERNGCFTGSCHGPDVFNDLKFAEPLPRRHHDEPLRLSPSMVAENRAAALGTVSRLVNLGGDLQRSRLLVKNLPIPEGGVHQRGGNTQFFESVDDPDARILLEWMGLEQEALAQRLTSRGEAIAAADLGRLQGIAFLRGPRHAPRRFFDLDPFWPGTQLMALPKGARVPHTLVSDPDGEIQAFDVRYDARAVVFSWRTAADRGFRVFEVDLDAELGAVPGSLRQVSFGANRLEGGSLVHHIDPIYSPGPTDPDGVKLDAVAITYSSNAGGSYAASTQFAILGEADSGDGSNLVDFQRFEAPGTFDDLRLHVIDGPMTGEWRTIVSHRDQELVFDRPLPLSPDPETVYVIEQTNADVRSSFDVWRFIPGRFEDSNRRQTWTHAQERRPTHRTTGETMFTSVRNRGWQGDRPVFNGAVFRTQAGGFDYHIHGGNRSGVPLYSDSRELPSGLEVRLAHDPRNLWAGGQLILVDHGFGVNIEPDNPVDHLAYTAATGRPESSSQRFLPTHLPLFDDRGVTPTGVSPAGSFRDPFPHSDGSIFAAQVTDSLDHLDPGADPDWDLVRLQTDGSLQTEDGYGVRPLRRLLLQAANTTTHAEFSPRPIAIRLKDKPVTHQKFATRTDGRTPRDIDGVLRMDPGLPGEVECYDYPLLQSFLVDFTPVGRRTFLDDELAYVRIVQQLPTSAEDAMPVDLFGFDTDPFATRVSLGVHQRSQIVAEIPIEPDGSFYAQVPSEVPLVVQGLNRDRMAIHSMNRWFYVQPGEKLTFSIPRSIFPIRCAGCHGALTGDKQDALGPPDLVSAASRVMATWDPVRDGRRAPAPIQLSSVDFVADVQPILDRRCVSCHNSDDPTAGLDLTGGRDGPYTVAYTQLHALRDPESGNHADKRYINEREGLSSESFLIEKLADPSLEPHPPGDPIQPDELLTLIRWIDLGATFLGGDR